jgi:hypothetical protein
VTFNTHALSFYPNFILIYVYVGIYLISKLVSKAEAQSKDQSLILIQHPTRMVTSRIGRSRRRATSRDLVPGTQSCSAGAQGARPPRQSNASFQLQAGLALTKR